MNKLTFSLITCCFLASAGTVADMPKDTTGFERKIIALNEQLPDVMKEAHILIAANKMDEEMVELNDEIIEFNEEMAEMTLELEELVKTLRHMGDEKSTNRAFLGILLDDHKGVDEGVQIIGVTPDGPAQRAGLQAADVILNINGQSIAKDHEHMPASKLHYSMKKVKPGDKVTLLIDRDGQNKEIELTTSNRSDHVQYGLKFLADDLEKRLKKDLGFEQYYGPLSGVELYPMNKQLGQYFGTTTGMLVLNVPDDKQDTLMAGDVLLKIGDRIPKSPSQTWRILDSYDKGETIELTLMRQHKETVQKIIKP